MTAQTPYFDASSSQDATGALDQQLIDAEVDSLPPPAPPKFGSTAARLLFAVSLVLIAFNLRPIFPSLSVVLPEVIRDTGLSTVGASLLTTLPVLCLGVFAPFAPGLAQRYGAEKTLAGALLLLALGSPARRGYGLASVFRHVRRRCCDRGFKRVAARRGQARLS
jgi:CP family cyanate transporter-like MFS transporter